MTEISQQSSETATEMTLEQKMQAIVERTGYTYEVTAGQRKYTGPPPGWTGANPTSGCEIYCGKIPPSVQEDELILLFEQCGTIWDMRLMVDPTTNQHKGFCFCMFADKAGAEQACKQLEGHAVRPNKPLKVNISTPNCRLFMGNIPKSRSKDEILEEVGKVTDGLLDVIVYSVPDDPKKKNRGFAFLDYDTHKSAASARKRLSGGRVRIFNCDIICDWADPSEEPDSETMSKEKQALPPIDKPSDSENGTDEADAENQFPEPSDADNPPPCPDNEKPQEARKTPSLMDQIKISKVESKGFGLFFLDMISIICDTIGFTILLTVLAILPITMLVFGAIYLNDCPYQRYIPIYLIVTGSFGVARIAFSLLEKMCRIKMKRNLLKGAKSFYHVVNTLVDVFLLAWYFAGRVWIFSIERNFDPDDIMSAKYCNPALFSFALWIIKATGIVIVCGILCLIGTLVVACDIHIGND